MVGIDHTKGDDWEKLAGEYAKLTHETSLKPIGLMLERADALLPFSKATGILDDGCGPGPIMARMLKDYGSDIPGHCKLLCTDFSEPMLKQVENQKAAAAAHSPWKRVEIKLQDATDLKDVADNSQSHVTAGMVFFMTPNPLKCLTESRRVLKENGVLAVSSWESSQWMDLMGSVADVRQDKKMPEIPEHWRDVSSLERELQKAGFKETEGHRVSVDMAFQSHESIVEFCVTRLPHMIALTKDMSETEIGKLKDLMISRAKQMCPDEPGKLTGVAVIGIGRK